MNVDPLDSGVLENSENHELGWLNGRDAELADKSPVLNVVLRHGHIAFAGDEGFLESPDCRVRREMMLIRSWSFAVSAALACLSIRCNARSAPNLRTTLPGGPLLSRE
jgi:hypothetical protein